jgi:hypothetical protein
VVALLSEVAAAEAMLAQARAQQSSTLAAICEADAAGDPRRDAVLTTLREQVKRGHRVLAGRRETLGKCEKWRADGEVGTVGATVQLQCVRATSVHSHFLLPGVCARALARPPSDAGCWRS